MNRTGWFAGLATVFYLMFALVALWRQAPQIDFALRVSEICAQALMLGVVIFLIAIAGLSFAIPFFAQVMMSATILMIAMLELSSMDSALRMLAAIVLAALFAGIGGAVRARWHAVRPPQAQAE